MVVDQTFARSFVERWAGEPVVTREKPFAPRFVPGQFAGGGVSGKIAGERRPRLSSAPDDLAGGRRAQPRRVGPRNRERFSATGIAARFTDDAAVGATPGFLERRTHERD